jgi:hypothetical protein
MARNRNSPLFPKQPHNHDTNPESEILSQRCHRIAVIERAIACTLLDKSARRALYEYTYAHISEPNLLATSLLAITNSNLPDLRGFAFLGEKWPSWPTQEERTRLFEAHEVARDIIDHAALIDDDYIIQNGHSLVRHLQQFDHPEEPGALGVLEYQYLSELEDRGYVRDSYGYFTKQAA